MLVNDRFVSVRLGTSPSITIRKVILKIVENFFGHDADRTGVVSLLDKNFAIFDPFVRIRREFGSYTIP